MSNLKLAVQFFQDNWALLLILAAGAIILLKAIANFRVRYAKVTPDPQDDVEAKLFKAKVMVFVMFLKDLFSLNKKKDKAE